MSDPLRTGTFPRANAARGRDVLATMALVRALTKEKDGKKIKENSDAKHQQHKAEHAERSKFGRGGYESGFKESSFNRAKF